MGKHILLKSLFKFKTKAFENKNSKDGFSSNHFVPTLHKTKDFFSKYPGIVFKKIFFNENWGDTIKYDLKGKAVKVVDLSQFYTVIFSEPVKMWETIYEIRKFPEVESVDPPCFTVTDIEPNDTHYSSGQWYLPKIQAPSAWDITTGSSNIVCAVVDKGVNISHLDLSSKILGGETDYSGGTDNHGTRVAGIIGAITNNSRGMASLGWNTMIRPYNMDNTTNSTADLYSAVSSGAQIINCSWHNVSVDPNDNTKYVNYDNAATRSAISNAIAQGRIVVASAGNAPGPFEINGITRQPSEYPPYISYPASYPGVIAVSATNNTDGFPSGYNYGDLVDISAPGIDIFTTNADGTYSRHNGTSFAAPMVSALAGLIMSKNPGAFIIEITNNVFAASDDLGSAGRDNYFGFGRINAYKAVRNLYVPQAFSSIERAASIATIGQNILVSGINTLSENLTIPSGISLTILSGASVNLNGHSIISTGGTITKESGATITGAAAYITETGILKGLCPTIQAALTNAPSSGCFVEIQPGTYSENVSISNKSYLIITGDELNSNLTGSMSFYSCPDLYISNINSKNVTLSNCASPDIRHTVNGSGTGGGIHLFDCTDFQRTGEVSNAAYGLSANGGNGYIYGTASFYSNDVAVNSSNSSDIVLEYSQLCGNITTDLYAITGGDIYAYECYYNNATPRIYEYLNGNVDVSGVRDCGLMKRGSETEFPTSIIPDNLKTDDPEALAYLTLKNEYYKLFRKIKDDIKLLGVFHKDKFRNEHISIIKSYKAFLNKYPNSKYSKNALTAAAKSFWRYDDYPGMKKFLDDILADKEMASLKGTAENLFVDYYRDIKDFDKAIKQADYISEEYGYDENLVCGAMYNKALLLAHDLNRPDEAVACLRNIIKNYPENDLKQFAENELIVLGVEKETKPASSESGELEFATSSYPNPFNPSTTISYQLPKDGMVTLKIYDAIGREVKTLVDEFKQKGKYTINFNASELASGVYFYRINVNGFSVSKKLMLLK